MQDGPSGSRVRASNGSLRLMAELMWFVLIVTDVTIVDQP